jgi:hypothetical protein
MLNRMKFCIYLIFIVLVSCALKHGTIKHTKNYIFFKKFNGDTLAYLNANFLNQKGKYIHKPLSFLLNDMEVEMHAYLFGSSWNDTLVPDISISAISRGELSRRIDMRTNPFFIYAIFEKGPGETIARNFRVSHETWTKETANFYGGYVIKDIKVSNY